MFFISLFLNLLWIIAQIESRKIKTNFALIQGKKKRYSVHKVIIHFTQVRGAALCQKRPGTQSDAWDDEDHRLPPVVAARAGPAKYRRVSRHARMSIADENVHPKVARKAKETAVRKSCMGKIKV